MHRAFDPEADEHRQLPMTPGSTGGSKRMLADSVHLSKAYDMLRWNRRSLGKEKKSQFGTQCSIEDPSAGLSEVQTTGSTFRKESKCTVHESVDFNTESAEVAGRTAAPKSKDVSQLRKNLLSAT